MRRFILTLTVLAAAPLTHAQSAIALPQPTPNISPAIDTITLPKEASITSAWPPPTTDPRYEQNIDVLTLTDPTHRHSCHVRSITSESLTCRSNLSHHVVTYRRDQVAALIDPPDHSTHNTIVVCYIVSAVALGASFFVPMAASIILRIIASYSFVMPATADNNLDHPSDHVLYQRPNTSLKIALR